MKTFGLASAATAALTGALFASSAAAADLPPIVIKGSHFFYENGTEFFIRGVAYQQDVNANSSSSATYTDPLADEAGCKRDIPLLQELGTNTIRVYAINAFICLTPHPRSTETTQNGTLISSPLMLPLLMPWLTTQTFSVFFAGNEVSNDVNNTNASAFVKAAVRDTKAYIKTKNYRKIGVGYATNDDAAIRIPLAHYFNCGDADDAIDFWGYNIYSWCGDSSFTKSGYDQRTLEFANYSVGAIYGDKMTNVWSGGIVYMYFQEANDYGLVSVSGDTVSKLPDFTALSKQLATVTPSFTNSASYTPTNTVAQACPATGTAWAASSNLPPIANAELCECMVKSLSCVADSGISGDSSAELFDYVCGLDSKACDGIGKNATTGVYGAYSMCTGSQQLSFVFDQYYQNQNKASTACDFNGSAKLQSGSKSSTCSSLISQAGTAGTGTVTSAPTGTGASSSSSASTTSTSKSSSGSTIVPRLDLGLLQLGAYVVAAGMAGAGMILL
ncbi:hypothetical protein DID88_001605 [Monilinia fructigena]|uniref:1,3-beta-glucanosyltransferase n=1 Tax=Monilinia fructigena TaxID=38457 RepID=A0A395IWA1_9HELO|nr:hypothetical protein DID88_001605 [Monilinia fructigena]